MNLGVQPKFQHLYLQLQSIISLLIQGSVGLCRCIMKPSLTTLSPSSSSTSTASKCKRSVSTGVMGDKTEATAKPMLSEEQSLAIESLMCMKTQGVTHAPASTKVEAETKNVGIANKNLSSIPPPPPLGPSLEELEQTTTSRAKAALVSWYQRLNELYQFKLKYGHCDVPQKFAENRCLGIWVNKQRCERVVFDECLPKKAKYTDDLEPMKTSLTVKKLLELEKIGFVWAKRKGEYIWNQHYNDLKSFFLQHGHSNLPCKYKPKPTLGRWITSQRSQFKRGTLPQEYIEKLDAIAFTWDMYAKSPEELLDQDIQQQEDENVTSSMETENYKCNGARLVAGTLAMHETVPKYIGTHEAQVRARLGHPPLVKSNDIANRVDQATKIFDTSVPTMPSKIPSTNGKENSFRLPRSKGAKASPTKGMASKGIDMPQFSNNLDLLVQIASGEVQVNASNSKPGEGGTRKRKGGTKSKSTAFLPLSIQPNRNIYPSLPLAGSIGKNKRAKRSSMKSCHELKASSFTASTCSYLNVQTN